MHERRMMDRRGFLHAGGAATLGSVLPVWSHSLEPNSTPRSDAFEWSTKELKFSFEIVDGRLRQKGILPSGSPALPEFVGSGGVEVALQCTGEDSPDQGLKSGIGQPGARLRFVEKREETTEVGRRLRLVHTDPMLALDVESIYESFDSAPMVRRFTRVTNRGTSPVGVEFLSSAMLHGVADPQHYDRELRIHLARNSWMAEGQWHTLRPSELGFVENERTSWSEASAGSIGTWSAEKYIPMAIVENLKAGLAWFWQIEHDGSWYWEISNVASRGNHADDVYAYLGGPDELHAAAWKNLEPGETYETVLVAIGCVKGGVAEAIESLTHYRRHACKRARKDGEPCPVIFNDYMNCLWGDPTEAKELPMIEAAAKAGCEYYVIDAGWYAEINEDWSKTIGSWEPSLTRWPHGLKYVLDKIRQAGMRPGLWLEPEVAGVNSTLAKEHPDWFFVRHGRRVLKNERYLLDFRIPEVRAYLSQVIGRLVADYGTAYIKMDYNVDSLQGTDVHADSVGQGLLEHSRAYLAWIDQILDRYPDLVLENCGSGGGRLDYAQLSRFQIQSVTDQEDYLKLPAIVTGSSAAVLPEQLGIWSYPVADSNPDKASFNLVTAMMGRIHQSGRLDQLAPSAFECVRDGIDVYKKVLRQHTAQAIPFYPLEMPDVTDSQSPVALGMRSPGFNWMAVWRLDGPAKVIVPLSTNEPRILFPSGLGISISREYGRLVVDFPRTRMACLLSV
jgi:alpha-galactosidase